MSNKLVAVFVMCIVVLLALHFIKASDEITNVKLIAMDTSSCVYMVNFFFRLIKSKFYFFLLFATEIKRWPPPFELANRSKTSNVSVKTPKQHL